MTNSVPTWPCQMCGAVGERPADILGDILQLAAAGAGPDLPRIADLVGQCLKHGNTTGACPDVPSHCARVELARTEAAGGNWPACIVALDHP